VGVRSLLIVRRAILAQVPFPALVDAKNAAIPRAGLRDHSAAVGEARFRRLRREPASSSLAGGRGVGLAPFPGELPATRGEVDAFRTLLPHATVRLGAEATEAELRRSLTLGVPVHVATHAMINARNPMFSRIEMARPREAAIGGRRPPRGA
jgi:CHAT domain-containing protein